jgi:hypothetical protein
MSCELILSSVSISLCYRSGEVLRSPNLSKVYLRDISPEQERAISFNGTSFNHDRFMCWIFHVLRHSTAGFIDLMAFAACTSIGCRFNINSRFNMLPSRITTLVSIQRSSTRIICCVGQAWIIYGRTRKEYHSSTNYKSIDRRRRIWAESSMAGNFQECIESIGARFKETTVLGSVLNVYAAIEWY